MKIKRCESDTKDYGWEVKKNKTATAEKKFLSASSTARKLNEDNDKLLLIVHQVSFFRSSLRAYKIGITSVCIIRDSIGDKRLVT